MGWLGKLPVVSVLLAAAMIAVPHLVGEEGGRGGVRFESAREEARAYLIRHPRLQVDALGKRILDPIWLEEARAAAAFAQGSGSVELPARMLARTQTRLDALLDRAYEARLEADPAWRYGVLDSRTPSENYFAHAFLHETLAGLLLCVAVLLLAAAPLERTWGFGIFSLFALAAIPLTAQAHRLLDAGSGVPWSGSAGLVGALLGAYFIRGLGGHFVVPGWLLLPVWLVVEVFVVRETALDALGGLPWASFCASVGFGAGVAGALRLLGVEGKLDAVTARSAGRGPNPVIARAARLRTDGDPYQALDLIQAAWREDPSDDEVAESYFSIAVEVGQPQIAAEAILPSLRRVLRAGDMQSALEYWLPIASAGTDIRLEATAAVRLGEALLDAGHPEQALFSLRSALEVGVSPALAVRTVNIARDLDEGLTRQAATIALTDLTLDPKLRAELEQIAAAPPDPTLVDASSSEAAGGEPGASSSPLDRRIHAEHHAVESTAFPIDADSDASRQGEAAAVHADPNEAQLAQQSLDPHALSAESFSSGDPTAAGGDDRAHADTLSHWSDPPSLDDLENELSSPFVDADDLIEPEELDALAETRTLAESEDLVDPAEAETDSDMTPLLEASDELTSPLAAPADEMTVVAPGGEGALDEPEPAPVAHASAEDFAIGVEPAPADGPPRRALKALEAVPLEVRDEQVEIDVEGHGKSKLPLSRIQAIGMAAVAGLAARPVLVVDLALNWLDGRSEPLKVIRFRSDRFDPRAFEPGEVDPLQALTAWVRRLQAGGDATCLPSRELLEGRFARFDSVEAYEREVLMACSAAGTGGDD